MMEMSGGNELASRGFEEASKGNFRSAVDWFTSALDLNRCDFSSLANRSLSYYQIGRYDAAAADAHRATQLRPLEPKGHYLLARALLALRRFREADRAISQAARLLPADPMQHQDDFQLEVLRMQCQTAAGGANGMVSALDGIGQQFTALDARTTVSSDSGHSSPSGDESYAPTAAALFSSSGTKRHSSDLTNSQSFASMADNSGGWCSSSGSSSHFRPASRPLLFGCDSGGSNFGFGIESDSVWSTSNKTTESSGGWPDFNNAPAVSSGSAFPALGSQLRASSDLRHNNPLVGLGQVALINGSLSSNKSGTGSRPISRTDMHYPQHSTGSNGAMTMMTMNGCSGGRTSRSSGSRSPSCDLARVQNILHFKAIFVDNVSGTVTVDKMMEVFSPYGPVVSIVVKPVLGNVPTFACIEFTDFESPENAVTDAMNNPLIREGLNFDLKQPLSVKFTPSASERRALSSGCQARTWAQNVIERSGECFEWRFASSCSLGKNCFRKHIVRHRQIDTLKSFTL